MIVPVFIALPEQPNDLIRYPEKTLIEGNTLVSKQRLTAYEDMSVDHEFTAKFLQLKGSKKEIQEKFMAIYNGLVKHRDQGIFYIADYSDNGKPQAIVLKVAKPIID